MLDYGSRDMTFAVNDAGFAIKFAYFLKTQIRNYEPLVDHVDAQAGMLVDDEFRPGFTADQQRAAIRVEYTERGSRVPRNLVYPIWRLRQMM